MKTPWQELSKTRTGRLADKSQKMILTQYNSLIGYAKDHDLGIKGSPAKNIVNHKKTIIKKKDRKPYTQEELQSLINLLALVDREKEANSSGYLYCYSSAVRDQTKSACFDATMLNCGEASGCASGI